MMKKVTLTKLESIMQRMRKTLRTIEKVNLELGLPGVQVRIDSLLQAGVDAELMELSIKVQSKNTQNFKQPYRPYLLSASSPAEVRAG